MMNEEMNKVETGDETVTSEVEEIKESKLKNVVTKVWNGVQKHHKKIIGGAVIIAGGYGLYKLFGSTGVDEVILADDIIEEVIEDVVDDVVSEAVKVTEF